MGGCGAERASQFAAFRFSSLVETSPKSYTLNLDPEP